MNTYIIQSDGCTYLECKLCGKTRPINLPMKIDDLVFYLRSFESTHKACK